MKSEIQHTPMPWKSVNYKSACDFDPGHDIAKVIDESGNPVRVILATRDFLRNGEAEANAEFIVRAVNSYEGMISEIAVKNAVIEKITKHNEALFKWVKQYRTEGDLSVKEMEAIDKDLDQVEEAIS